MLLQMLDDVRLYRYYLAAMLTSMLRMTMAPSPSIKLLLVDMLRP
jgi:hypothetical protein